MKLNHSIGMMQGRLTHPRGRGIQFFPFENWENEFMQAAEIGLDEIEFIFDYDNYQNNPLWKDNGQRLAEVARNTGVKVKAVCFDYFMRRPFFKYQGKEKEDVYAENETILKHILGNMRQVGIGLIEIPLVDGSSMKTENEKNEFLEFLQRIANDNPGDIKYGLEADLPPDEFLHYLERFQNRHIGANYDSGNSSGIGYDPYEEITILKDFIYNIHIKDRIYQGGSVELGTGSADFERLFTALQQIRYKNSFILQAARGQDGHETENIRMQKSFVEGYIAKYLSIK